METKWNGNGIEKLQKPCKDLKYPCQYNEFDFMQNANVHESNDPRWVRQAPVSLRLMPRKVREKPEVILKEVQDVIKAVQRTETWIYNLDITI